MFQQIPDTKSKTKCIFHSFILIRSFIHSSSAQNTECSVLCHGLCHGQCHSMAPTFQWDSRQRTENSDMKIISDKEEIQRVKTQRRHSPL
jgi:hypothetical protein